MSRHNVEETHWRTCRKSSPGVTPVTSNKILPYRVSRTYGMSAVMACATSGCHYIIAIFDFVADAAVAMTVNLGGALAELARPPSFEASDLLYCRNRINRSNYRRAARGIDANENTVMIGQHQRAKWGDGHMKYARAWLSPPAAGSGAPSPL